MEPGANFSMDDHSLCDLAEDLETLDLFNVDVHEVTMTTLVNAFKRKSFLFLPSKHKGLATAHSRFEQLNTAFLKVMKVQKSKCKKFISAFGAQFSFEGL